MFGDIRNAVEELLEEMKSRRAELGNRMNELDEGQAEFEDCGMQFDYMDDCITTAERLLDELEEAEGRFD